MIAITIIQKTILGCSKVIGRIKMPKRLILHQFNVLNLNGTHDGKASRIVVVSTPTQSALFQQPKIPVY